MFDGSGMPPYALADNWIGSGRAVGDFDTRIDERRNETPGRQRAWAESSIQHRFRRFRAGSRGVRQASIERAIKQVQQVLC
jgi:hypothetical protein